MTNHTRVDDKSIEGHDHLLRRIHRTHVIFDSNRNQLRPSSAAFTDSRDGNPMSVYVESILVGEGRPPVQVLERYPEHSLASFTAGEARAVNLGIVKEIDPSFPEETAHAVVFGAKTKAVQRHLAAACVWVALRHGGSQRT